MSVNDCIKQYWIMTNRIFVPQRTRFIQYYSRKKLQEAAKAVVQRYCHCHQGDRDGCSGTEDLRQHDFTEETNKTCRVYIFPSPGNIPY
jgi:hypothetical protein